MHDLKMSDKEYVIDEAAWKNAYEDCKQYFEDGEMLGWFVVHPGAPLIPEPETVKLHKMSGILDRAFQFGNDIRHTYIAQRLKFTDSERDNGTKKKNK